MTLRLWNIIWAFYVCVLIIATASHAQTLHYPCDEQAEPATMTCELRTMSGREVDRDRISVTKANGDPIKFDYNLWNPREHRAAYLFLIQTGGLAHPNDSLAQVRRIIQASRDSNRMFGVYTFGSSATPLVELDAPRLELDELQDKKLERTESALLFSSISSAVDKLSDAEADRKVLIVLGDGKSGRETIYKDDIVSKLSSEEIILITLPFTDRRGDRDVRDGIATLRELGTAKSWWSFEDPGAERVLSAEFISKFYKRVENNGYLQVDLSDVFKGERVNFKLHPLSEEEGQTVYAWNWSRVVSVGKDNPSKPQVAAGEEDITEETETTDSSEAQTPGLFEDPIAWAGENILVIIAALGLLFGAIAFGLFDSVLDRKGGRQVEAAGNNTNFENVATRTMAAARGDFEEVQDLGTILVRRDEQSGGASATDESSDGMAAMSGTRTNYGYLECLDGEMTRYPIDARRMKIGRDQLKNEIYLGNDSVHHIHAEVEVLDGGKCVIRDISGKEKGNGVRVNKKLYSEKELKNNDLIELGDVRMRYRTA